MLHTPNFECVQYLKNFSRSQYSLDLEYATRLIFSNYGKFINSEERDKLRASIKQLLQIFEGYINDLSVSELTKAKITTILTKPNIRSTRDGKKIVVLYEHNNRDEIVQIRII